MKIIIIEDEIPALEKLERYILKYDESIEIAARLASISETVIWLQNEENGFDIAFMDIQLTDGLSFEIFNQVTIDKPVIFTTAFDEYAVDAFKVNSIDYILKPITFTDVSKALNKYKKLMSFLSPDKIKLVSKDFERKKHKNRFLVRLGNHIHSIKTDDITLFYAEGRTVFLVTNEKKKYILDYTLEELSNVLNNKEYYRVNRTYIVNLNAISDVIVYSNSRLKLSLKINAYKDIVVSRERVSSFKNWLEGN